MTEYPSTVTFDSDLNFSNVPAPVLVSVSHWSALGLSLVDNWSLYRSIDEEGIAIYSVVSVMDTGFQETDNVILRLTVVSELCGRDHIWFRRTFWLSFSMKLSENGSNHTNTIS